MRKNSIISSAVLGNTLTFTVEGAGEIVLDMSQLSEMIRDAAMIHGLTQKVSDAAAISKADLPGDPAEAAKLKFSQMQSVAHRLLDGEWKANRGDGAAPVAGIIYRAFERWAMAKAKAAKASLSADQCRAVYDAKTRADQLALRKVPEIAAIIEEMKAERGADKAKVDASALLGELGI